MAIEKIDRKDKNKVYNTILGFIKSGCDRIQEDYELEINLLKSQIACNEQFISTMKTMIYNKNFNDTEKIDFLKSFINENNLNSIE